MWDSIHCLHRNVSGIRAQSSHSSRIPSNRSLLMENIDRNHVENVTVVPAAVSDEPGQMHLQVSTFNTGDHRLYRERSSGVQTVETAVVSVDSWLESAGMETVDMIKMDVQGAEANVLAGMRRTLASSRRLKMIIEYTLWMLRESGADPIALLTGLETAGSTSRSSMRLRAQSFRHHRTRFTRPAPGVRT